MAIEYAPRSFEPEKAIAALAYLVERAGVALYPVMKMFYLADRRHLERYGRFIAGDAYVAMEEGPVPKGAYNLIKAARGEDIPVPGGDSARELFKVVVVGKNHNIEILGDVDYDELSRSDIECLDEVISDLKDHGKQAIITEAHDAAWKKAWADGSHKAPAMTIQSIAETLNDAEKLIAHIDDPNPGKAN